MVRGKEATTRAVYLIDEGHACTAILSNLEGTALKCVVAKKKTRMGYGG